MKNFFKHQGDIPFYSFSGDISGEKVTHDGSLVLALGEHTGHKHVITVPSMDDMVAYKTADGGWILELKTDGVVTHDQHGQITIPRGVYRVGREREFDWFAQVQRQVID